MVRKGLLKPDTLWRVALGLLAGTLAGLVYTYSLELPFVLDDRVTVLLNPSLVDPFAARGILLYDRLHPIVNLSYAADTAFWGLSSFGFHLTNGVLHLTVVALLYGAFTRMRGEAGKGQGVNWAAFFAAATFGVNPLAARSVAYVSARPDLLTAAGVLVVVILARRARQRSSAVMAALAVAAAAITLGALPYGFTSSPAPSRMYLTSAAVSFAAAWALTPTFARWRAARAAIGPLLWILAVLTVREIARWSDPLALWEEATRRAPAAWEAHAGYAEALREAGRCGDAAREFAVARRLNPAPAESSPGETVCR